MAGSLEAYRLFNKFEAAIVPSSHLRRSSSPKQAPRTSTTAESETDASANLPSEPSKVEHQVPGVDNSAAVAPAQA